MHLKSILNRVEPLKSFVYKEQRLIEVPGSQPFLEVDIEPRANGRPVCSGCGKKGAGYDRLAARRFEFVPLWNMAVFFVYAMRRVDCPACGVTVERVPWATGKEHLTTSYRWFLARWAKRLSWTDTAVAFNTTWENVFRSVKRAVSWGTDKQATRLAELLQYNLKSVKAHLLREEFQRFWAYASPAWVGKFLESWCTQALRSRLTPMKKVVKSLRRHRPLILNWFLALGAISAGIVEGFNGKAKLTTRKAYGFRTPEGIEFALLHVMGNLPEPESTHRIC